MSENGDVTNRHLQSALGVRNVGKIRENLDFFLFFLHSPTRESVGSPIRDLQFSREVAFPYIGRSCLATWEFSPWLPAGLGTGAWFPELIEFCVSPNFFASGGRSAAAFVRIFRNGLFVEFRVCFLVSFGRWMSIWLARSTSIGAVFSAVFGRGVDAQATTAARSALSVFGVCGCGVF